MSVDVEVRRLSSCTFADALTAWNEGFQGYFVDMTLSLDAYLARLQREGLSPEHSFLAFCAGRPVGFLLNGLRTTAGERVAWNGGTGVSSEFRGKGVGKALLRATIELYRELEVDVAMLEAISENENAISLYKQFGYQINDRLASRQHEGTLDADSFGADTHGLFSVTPSSPQLTGTLGFYPRLVPWQSQWESLSLSAGEALVVSNRDDDVVGYALYKKKSDEQGRLAGIVLYQCVADPDCADADAVIRCALQYLYAPFGVECRRTTYNLAASSERARQVLQDAGFSLFVEQVQMVRRS